MKVQKNGKNRGKIFPWIATVAAVSALGASAMTAQAAPAPVTKGKVTTPATADPNFPAKERAASASVKSTKASRDALAKVQARVAKYVAKNGTQYTFATWADANGNVVVETNAPVRVRASVTNLKSDPSVASVKVQTRKTEKLKDVWNRRDDVPAYYGGGGLRWNNILCSTGYPVKTASGYRYMVTAGHCYPNGASVNTESNLRRVGIVTGRALASLGGGPRDMELLYGESYAGRIFTGGVTSTTSRPIVAAGSASANYNNYCHSGRTTGEQCGHTATSVIAQVCTATGCKSPVIRYTGGTLSAGGDSGGAFYAKDANGGAWIRGHVIAGNSTEAYAETYNKVAAYYGVSVVTG
jgi:hypothetical protein